MVAIRSCAGSPSIGRFARRCSCLCRGITNGGPHGTRTGHRSRCDPPPAAAAPAAAPAAVAATPAATAAASAAGTAAAGQTVATLLEQEQEHRHRLRGVLQKISDLFEELNYELD